MIGFRLGVLSKKLYFFGIADGMYEADKVRMAWGVYTAFRATSSLWHNGGGACDVGELCENIRGIGGYECDLGHGLLS